MCIVKVKGGAMKGLLLIVGALFAIVAKVISVVLAIAIILWLIGLFGITGSDVLIVLFAMIGLYIASAILFVIIENQD